MRLVVRPNERNQHQHANLLILPEEVQKIAAVRHWLVHRNDELGNKIVMMDDDMVFAARRTDDPTKFRHMEDEDYDTMFEALRDALGEYAHVGISHREGANRNTNKFVECSRQMRVLGYQRNILRAEAVTGRTKVMEDFDVTLQLLRRGMPNRILNSWVHNQGGSDTRGTD